MISTYCKRCYFRGINFSRLAAQKHIRGLLSSRWADAHLSFLYCTKLTSINEWYIYKYVCNWAAQKQSRSQTDSSICYPFASTHMVNTQLLRVQNVHTKYRKYFRGFLNLRLLNFARNSRKLMYRKYFHFYSNSCFPWLQGMTWNVSVYSYTCSYLGISWRRADGGQCFIVNFLREMILHSPFAWSSCIWNIFKTVYCDH